MQNQPESATVAANDLKGWLDSGAPVTILDVRDPDEFSDWHIKGAVNLPLDRIQAGESPTGANDARVVTVCAHGHRSATARDLLRARGVSATSLEGGMFAWNGVYDIVALSAPAGVAVRQLRRVGKGCLSYLLVSGDEAATIDATLDTDAYVAEATRLGAHIVAAIDTHAHADHVSGSSALAQATGATYFAPQEVDARPHATVTHGSHIPFGAAHLVAVHTPGHTPESMTYLLGDVLAFTGDTLFVESVGRPDLGQDVAPNARLLWATLQALPSSIPDGALVAPGHYGAAVALKASEPVARPLARLRAELPAFSMDEEAFVQWIVANKSPQPLNFLQIKKHNRGTERVDDEEELRELEAGPNRCAVST